MVKVKAWFKAVRLRTIPLSISGVIVGTALAKFYGYHNWLVFLLALCTAVCFQVTSNLANDYGDGVKGTDNEDRIGPPRALQSGLLSKFELKNGIAIAVFISLILTLVLLYVAFGTDKVLVILVFLGLAIASVWAAIKYTVGDSAYGYKGFGDIFVFLFFGLIAVLGSMFLYANHLTLQAIFPAITIGLLSAGVLNLNNLRDYISDKKAKKNTLIVKMGYQNGKVYHLSLLFFSFVSIVFFTLFNFISWLNLLYLLVYIPIFTHAMRVKETTEPVLLDPELKKLTLCTFFLAILFYISFNNFS